VIAEKDITAFLLLSKGAHAISDMVFVKNEIAGDLPILDVRGHGFLSNNMSAAKVLDTQEAIARFVAEAINEKVAREGGAE
jgi:hypothetical protein